MYLCKLNALFPHSLEILNEGDGLFGTGCRPLEKIRAVTNRLDPRP